MTLRSLLIIIIIALFAPLAANASSVTRVEFLNEAQSTSAAATVTNAPANVLSASTKTVNGSTISSFGPAPVSFHVAPSSTLGFARLQSISGAVDCTWDGSAPTEAAGMRLSAGNSVLVSVRSSALVQCVESANQPTSTSSY